MSSPEPLTFHVLPVDGKRAWPLFAPHHYLTQKYSGHRAFMAVLDDGSPVAFTSMLAAPSGHFRRGWREHRTVVLPDFQGLGLGARVSDWLGEYVLSAHTAGEGRFFSRTMHPRLGAYREASPLWRGTSHNRKPQRGSELGRAKGLGQVSRVSFAHEYIGHRLEAA